MPGMGWRGWHERLLAVYEQLGPHMTHKAFGDMVGENKGVVGNWLRGDYPPSLEQFDVICEATQTSFLWLVCGHDCDAPVAASNGLDHEAVFRAAKAVLGLLARRKYHQIIPDDLAAVLVAIAVGAKDKPERIVRAEVENAFESVYGKAKS
jgi:hypothetical protein